MGYHTTEPIAVLDFASLYPSIIIAHNLVRDKRQREPPVRRAAQLTHSPVFCFIKCYTTYVMPSDQAQLAPDQFQALRATTGTFAFVRASVKKGIVPTILEIFLDERKRVKRQLQTTTDPAVRAVLNGTPVHPRPAHVRALGLTGHGCAHRPPARAQGVGQCHLRVHGGTVVQAAVPPDRRDDNPHRRRHAHARARPHSVCATRTRCPKAPVSAADGRACGPRHRGPLSPWPSATVVYGDTDSVFVRFPDATVPESLVLARRLSEAVTNEFARPIRLEFEKIYFPCLLVNRKRYAGLLWTDAATPARIDVKGLENTSRGSCGVLVGLLDELLRVLLFQDR